MLKKLLVCLDGSKFAERILPHAIERAMAFNSRIILLRVIDVNIAAYVTPIAGQAGPIIVPATLGSSIREEEARAAAYLDGVSARLKGQGLDVESVVLHGVSSGGISSAIVNYSKENDVDLILMAPRRDSFWRRLLDGSITESVIRKSTVPVLVVKPALRVESSTYDQLPEGALA